jgi:hypothetical protein
MFAEKLLLFVLFEVARRLVDTDPVVVIVTDDAAFATDDLAFVTDDLAVVTDGPAFVTDDLTFVGATSGFSFEIAGWQPGTDIWR